MKYIDFITKVHTSTKRDYIKRVTEADKAECARIAKQFGYDYWDGNRRYGYGGYNYDGRWKMVAQDMVQHYHLNSQSSVLDVGCGKAHLLYEIKKLVPEIQVTGIDISEYAIKNTIDEIQPYLMQGSATALPFEDCSFDLVISLSTLHNLEIYDLKKAVQEIQRVSGKDSYIVVEAYETERQKVNLMYWQLTCECFFTANEWEWLYKEWGYTGDYSFIYFD